MEHKLSSSHRSPRIVRKVRRWRRVAGEVVRREGPIRLLARAGLVVRGVVYRHAFIVALDLSRPLPDIATAAPVEIRLLLADEADAYARFRARRSDAVLALRRLEKGDLCAAAWLDGEIVSAGWIGFERGLLDVVGRGLRLARDEAYIYDSYTTERVRGRSIASLRGRWAAAYLRENGYRRTIGLISPHNRPAFGPMRKLGYDTLGIAGFVRLGPWRRDFVKPVDGRRRWGRRDEPIDVGRAFP